MTPVYLNSQPPSPFPLEYHENGHQHHELLMISPKSQASSSSSSSSSPSLSCTTMFANPSLDPQGGYHHGDQIQLLGHQHEADTTFVSHGGSYDHTILENERDKYGLKLPIWKKKAKTSEDQNENDVSGSANKWMSSKMRLVRKMINGGTDRSAADAQINTTRPMFGGDHKQLISSSPFDQTDYNSNNNNNNNNNTIRVCSDCNTTKTPLWRSGPRGPKSLCNACGIRQRKARRAMAAAAAAAANGTILATSTTSHVKTKVQHKEKKKRSKKLGAAAPSSTGLSQKLCFEDFTLSLSEKYSAFQRVFPQDEKEAAILLMALSCGLVS